MAEFKVLQAYKDLELKEDLVPGDTVEMTVKRSEEIAKKLKDDGYDGEFLERVDKPKSKE
ncbi:hypothetical protein [Marinilactibacillus sp. Marseille-P9653]|uniref:hypothetical protein n=1 Tax=Marinilactibacillus sp. Marseille-P9653 TaxID=2866583 RepID=UPI001CE48E51|nr:hypothetical protein [Marinilactibacillus sp. Marseille-P9653]